MQATVRTAQMAALLHEKSASVRSKAWPACTSAQTARDRATACDKTDSASCESLQPRQASVMLWP